MDTRREVRQIWKQRVLPRVEKTSTCWVWQGAVTSSGYGTLGFRGRTLSVHVVAYQAMKGEIPKGHQIRHTCDNRLCVRPAHLLTGTHRDNARDAQERHRHRPWNAEKTHCPRGHEYEKAYGQRICRTCRRETSKRWNEKVARGYTA